MVGDVKPHNNTPSFPKSTLSPMNPSMTVGNLTNDHCSSRVLRAPQRRPSFGAKLVDGSSTSHAGEVLTPPLVMELEHGPQRALDVLPSSSRDGDTKKIIKGVHHHDNCSSSKVSHHIIVAPADEEEEEVADDATTSSSCDDGDSDSDATYVTSNQNKSVSSSRKSVASKNSRRSVAFRDEQESRPSVGCGRWSAGDGPSLSTTASASSYRSSRNETWMNSSNHSTDDHHKSNPGSIPFQNHSPEGGHAGNSWSTNGGHLHHTASKLTHQHSSSVAASSSTPLLLTKERVRSHMVDYCKDFDTIFRQANLNGEHWDAFFRQFFTKDIRWIRSNSSHPLDREGFKKLMLQDIVGIQMALVSTDSIQILARGKAAVVVFTTDQTYFYKGKQESDCTVLTSVLHVVNGRGILIGHEHRGKPIPNENKRE